MKAGSQRYDQQLVKKYLIGSIVGILTLCWISSIAAQSPFEEGREWYTQRSAEADSFRASPDNIDKAIEAYKSSDQDDIYTREVATSLLQAYHFKGMYTNLDDDKRKETFDKARALGEKMIDRYPKSAAIWYWYGQNLFEWDQMHNLWQTSIDRTDGKLRDAARQVVALDSTYQQGGGFRLLARIHYETPGIFLVKGWPSKDRALKLIQKALKIAPDNPSNQLFYARVLLHFGRNTEAKTQLQHIRDMELRPFNTVEDRQLKYRAEQLWDEHIEQSESEE